VSNILFISPSFFDYYKELKRELENQGNIVYWFDDRPKTNVIQKFLLRKKRVLLKKKIDRYFYNILQEMSNKKINIVFIILGQSFSVRHIEILKKKFNMAQFIYYTWDSVKNFPSSLELSKRFDVAYSFDNDDVKKYAHLKFLPLFFYDISAIDNNKIFDFSFVGTIKKGKYKIIFNIINKLKKDFPNHYVYMYLQHKLVFVFYKIFSNEFKTAKMRDFNYKPLSKEKTLDVFKKSKVVLDIPMSDQVGLTERTFETLSLQTKLLTTNINIKKYDFYNNKNIFVSENGNIPEKVFFIEQYDLNYNLSNKYNISNFIHKILCSEINGNN
jgi:hypothetical protein